MTVCNVSHFVWFMSFRVCFHPSTKGCLCLSVSLNAPVHHSFISCKVTVLPVYSNREICLLQRDPWFSHQFFAKIKIHSCSGFYLFIIIAMIMNCNCFREIESLCCIDAMSKVWQSLCHLRPRQYWKKRIYQVYYQFSWCWYVEPVLHWQSSSIDQIWYQL